MRRLRLPQENLVIVRYYTDTDLSASKDAFRPDFEMMLTHLHKGITPEGYPTHGVVAVDEDCIYSSRLSGSTSEAFRAAPDRVFADDYGTQDLYSENSEIIGLFRIAIAMGENGKRRSRTRRWREGQARRGITHTGERVFGYEPVEGKPGEIPVVPEEAAIIRKAVAACIANQSWGTITKIFNCRGYRLRRAVSGGIGPVIRSSRAHAMPAFESSVRTTTFTEMSTAS